MDSRSIFMQYKFYSTIVIVLFSFTISAQEKFNQLDTEGKRHGKWKKNYENSAQVRYEGTFEHGKEVGTFKFYKPKSGDKPTAIKVFKKDTDTVQVTYFTSKGGVISKGTLVGKKREGLWTYFHNKSDKVMMIETYKNDLLEGEQLTYFPNGKFAEKTTYTEGKRQGKRLIYSNQEVLIKEFTYVNDKLHGPTKYYDVNGKVSIEGDYKNDRKDGIWNYYENGKMKEQKLFPIRNRKKYN